MAIKWTENKLTELRQEGRGKGAGKHYIPWVQVLDFSSRGKSSRMFSPKVGRTVHLLSDVERGLFVLLEHCPQVIDIREQFPLDRAGTQSIAAGLGIAHPVYPKTSIPAVMTIDFLVDFETAGKRSLRALTCKTQKDLESPRTLEKLEIERTYFTREQIPFFLLVDTELPKTRIKNLEWIRNASLRVDPTTGDPGLVDLSKRFAHELRHTKQTGTLAQFCAFFDTLTNAAVGTGLRLARGLLAAGILQTDLNEPDLAGAPLTLFSVSEASFDDLEA